MTRLLRHPAPLRVREDAYLRISGPGWLALIFRDLLAGGWFLERVYD